MKWKINLLLILFCFAGMQVSAQETAVYEDAKDGAIQAAIDLFGENSQQLIV